MRSRSFWPAAVVLIALAGCSTRGPDRASVSSEAATDSSAAAAAVPVVVPLTAEQALTLATRPGNRATLVNVWATWCAPCKEELPALLRVARERARDGLRLVLISADFPDQLSAVHRFLAEQGVTDTTYLETGSEMTFINALSPRWSGALPATFVYDGRGQLTDFWQGKADSARFSRSIDALLASHTPSGDSRP
jgi:thiol-disulfide isomerase/thioredoxin